MDDIRKSAKKQVRKASKRPSWSVAEAKARFSEVIERARAGTPQLITKSGRNAVVVVSVDEWDKAGKPQGSFLEFLMNSPLRGSNINLEREKNPPREIDL